MKNLIKSVEFLVVVGGITVVTILGKMNVLSALIVSGLYIAINLMGWANDRYFK